LKPYPKTAKYDKDWIKKNKMGPNPVMLMEELCGNLDLRPGMKVLDMGCGKGLTSIFLAKEYGVTVFANDLWINPTDNLKRFEEAGVSDTVFPIQAEAHSLPYADGFFDAAVSVDSYHYYGTDETYFPCVYSKLVKPGGQFGIVCPGFTCEFENGFPDTMNELFADDMFTFHSALWWRKLWEKTGMAEITSCYNIEDAHTVWLDGAEKSDPFINADTEKLVTLIVLTAVKNGKRINIYDKE
jgi:cyclopropane fatty-acyl-phospholipid synthase-like methyltransferase